MDDDDDVEKEESIVVVVAAAFANITVQILCLETIEIEYCFVCDSPRVACFLRLLLSAGATRDVPMDEEKSFWKKRIYFWICDLVQNCYDVLIVKEQKRKPCRPLFLFYALQIFTVLTYYYNTHALTHGITISYTASERHRLVTSLVARFRLIKGECLSVLRTPSPINSRTLARSFLCLLDQLSRATN